MPTIQASAPRSPDPHHHSHRLRAAVRWGLRTGMGTLILATGIGKMLDIAGFAQVIDTYRFGLGAETLSATAVTITAFELLLGIWLLSGRHLSRAAIAGAVLNAGYFVLMSSSLMRGLELDNCGCFGVYFASPLRWYSPLEDVALTILCLVLWRLTRGQDAKRDLHTHAPSRQENVMSHGKPSGHYTVSPYLSVSDVRSSHAFLDATFAASPASNIQQRNGSIRHAEIGIGDSVVMLGTRPDEPDAPRCSIHVYVPDVDGCYHRALAAGATGVAEPADRPYGNRTCGIRDPDGNVWWIGTRMNELAHTS